MIADRAPGKVTSRYPHIEYQVTDIRKDIYPDNRTVSSYGRLDLNIHDELETKFRDAVYKTMGMKRGNLTTALEEAIMVWLKSKGMETDDKVWPEEEKALEDIKRGKTQMVTQKSDEFLAELKELENEP